VCYTCGCKMPYADPGVAGNLTEKTLEEAMKTKAAAGADTKNVKENIAELIRLEEQAGEEIKPKEQY
jgi:hypothetical protein